MNEKKEIVNCLQSIQLLNKTCLFLKQAHLKTCKFLLSDNSIIAVLCKHKQLTKMDLIQDSLRASFLRETE